MNLASDKLRIKLYFTKETLMKFKNVLLSVVSFMALSTVASFATFVNPKENRVNAASDMANYASFISSWSQSGHLYLHYNRGEKADAADYDQYALWLWQHKPQDIGGSLWAYSGKTAISKTLELDPMTTSFMTASEVKQSGSGMWIDQFGAIIDVDMTAQIRSGKKGGGDSSLSGATELGFLLVLQTSMGGTTHWTSDGGKNTYLEKINEAPKTNGAIHVYVNTGDLDNYVYDYSKVPGYVANPTVEEGSTENPQYNSKTQTINNRMLPANSSSSDIPATANSFKSLGVGYQIFVASFRDSNGDGIGDIRGIINSLDYLKSLGVQCLWLTPIQKSDSYHGYDISDYYAVDEKFGTVEDYRELIYKAHKEGMKVIMDLVLNHTSKSNVWFKNSQWAKESKDENGNTIQWRNVYHWKYETAKVSKYNKTAGNWSTSLSVKEDAESTNPSWYRDGLSHYYYYGKFGSGMPEINYEYQPTRDLVKNMAKYWLSFGLDGFRLDAVKHIYMKDEVADTGSDIIVKDVGSRTYYDNEKGKEETVDFDYSSDLNKNVTWWKEFSADLKKVYPNCFLVGENFDGYGNRTAAYYQALDSQFGFNHYYHIPQSLLLYGPGSYADKEPKEGEQAFRGKSAEYWVDGVQQADLPGGYRSDFIDGAFTSNHDVMRAINHAAYSGTQKVGTATETIDNDNITNSADQIKKAKIAATVTMLTPGLSWIYYGDELGMSSNTNTHVTKYGNENSKDIWYRQPFKWGGEAASQIVNYSAGGYKIEWDENNKNNVKDTEQQAADANSMLRYYQALGKLKQLYPKNAKVTYENPGNVLLFTITGEGSRTLKIFISIEWAGSSCSIYGVDGMTKFEDPAFGTVGNSMSESTPMGTIAAYYK